MSQSATEREIAVLEAIVSATPHGYGRQAGSEFMSHVIHIAREAWDIRHFSVDFHVKALAGTTTMSTWAVCGTGLAVPTVAADKMDATSAPNGRPWRACRRCASPADVVMGWARVDHPVYVPQATTEA